MPVCRSTPVSPTSVTIPLVHYTFLSILIVIAVPPLTPPRWYMAGVDSRHMKISTMADDNSMLSFIARRHTVGLENVDTDALSFILYRSTSSKRALSDFLWDDHATLQIARALPWAGDAVGVVPDLACLDENDNVLALTESKVLGAADPSLRHRCSSHFPLCAAS